MAFPLCVFQKRLCIVVVQTGSGTHFGGYDLQGTPAPAGNAPWRRGHLPATGAQDAILPHIRKEGMQVVARKEGHELLPMPPVCCVGFSAT